MLPNLEPTVCHGRETQAVVYILGTVAYLVGHE